MFKVIAKNGTGTTRTVYAVRVNEMKTVNVFFTEFLIFDMGRWEWMEADLYKPLLSRGV